MSRVRILGVGSPSGDDQAGWLVVDALLGGGGAGLDADIRKLDRPGAGLIPLLADASWVILVDAMHGDGAPGRIRRFDRQDWPGYASGLSSHGFGVLEALALAGELGGLPARLDLYGIEIASARPGEPAGPAVRAAACQVARELAATLERIQRS